MKKEIKVAVFLGKMTFVGKTICDIVIDVHYQIFEDIVDVRMSGYIDKQITCLWNFVSVKRQIGFYIIPSNNKNLLKRRIKKQIVGNYNVIKIKQYFLNKLSEYIGECVYKKSILLMGM